MCYGLLCGAENMQTLIGPYPRSKIVLCSADAGPASQREKSGEAGYFFPRGRWVGALRNAAERLGCRFVILTTAHGMVNPGDVIHHYDLHITEHKLRVTENWRQTIPHLLAGMPGSLLVFYSGGCPRDIYIEVLRPILYAQRISLITFGRPNAFDIGKIDEFVDLLMKGTSLAELRSILKCPDKLEFYPYPRQESI
jgi:hypothetical protein